MYKYLHNFARDIYKYSATYMVSIIYFHTKSAGAKIHIHGHSKSPCLSFSESFGVCSSKSPAQSNSFWNIDMTARHAPCLRICNLRAHSNFAALWWRSYFKSLFLEEKDLFILCSQCHGHWLPGDPRGQGIFSHAINLICLNYSSFSTTGVICWDQWLLLLTLFNFNPSMYKWSHAQ